MYQICNIVLLIYLRPACLASMAMRAPRRPVVLVCCPFTFRPQKWRRPLHTHDY